MHMTIKAINSEAFNRGHTCVMITNTLAQTAVMPAMCLTPSSSFDIGIPLDEILMVCITDAPNGQIIVDAYGQIADWRPRSGNGPIRKARRHMPSPGFPGL